MLAVCGNRGVLAVVAVLLVGCVAAPAAFELGAWQAPLGREHPLVGKIWDTRASASSPPTRWWRALTRARYVLLGERHDNPDHHRCRPRSCARCWPRAGGRRVAFEMFTADDAAPIARHLAAAPRDAAGLASRRLEALGLARLGALRADRPGGAGCRRAHRRRQPGPLDRAGAGARRPRGPAEQPRRAPRPRSPASGRRPRGTHRRDRRGALRLHPRRAAGRHGPGAARARRDAGREHARRAPGRRGADRGRRARPRPTAASRSTCAPARPTPRSPRWRRWRCGRAGRGPSDYAAAYGGARLPFGWVWFTPRMGEGDPCARLKAAGGDAEELSLVSRRRPGPSHVACRRRR